MIKKLWVKNYRSLADVTVQLEDLTVFVGHNGSGKSNLVDVFRFLGDAFRLGLDAAIVNRHGMSALLTLEEPELTIHPGALTLLWEEIESAVERSQIIVTTHSPDLLDLCKAEQLRVVEKVNGLTYVGPIEAMQKETIQERLFAPGELLRAHGLRREQQLSLI